MNTCCNLSLIPFDGQSATVINYTADLRARFGPLPSVEAYYRDPATGQYGTAVVQKVLDVPVTEIRVDHGGVASGYIKLKR